MPDGEYGTLVPFKEEPCQQANGCVEPAIYRCHKCGLLYCLDHASEIDPQRFCIKCLIIDDCKVEETPLVDAEGERHRGRVLRPVGNAFTAENRLIQEMSEDELKVYITQYKIIVRNHEQMVTFARINLAQAEHALLEKRIKTIEGAGGEVIFTSRPKAVKPTPKKKPDAVQALADKLKASGITPEMLQAIIDAKKKKAG
jgi:hypothetical protein